MSSNTQFRSIFEWGMWVQGADSPAAVLRAAAPYTLEGYAPPITCPTLVLDGENDPGTRPSSTRLSAARRPTTSSRRPKGAVSTAKQG